MAISTSSVVVAEEECSVQNKQNQIYWRIYAHNMRLNATGKSAWIKDEEYRDSIINVIGKAIGDCMALENEFRGNDREDIGNKVILFEGKDSEGQDKYKDPYDYTIKNWNAVYLYNAVNYVINERYSWFCIPENIMEECYRRIKNHYEQFYWIHTEDDKKRQRRNVSELDEQKELIKTFLNQKCKEALKRENFGFSQGDIDNIKKLQEAINNLDENKGDIENLVKDAIDKLKAAKTVLLGKVSFPEEYLTRERKKMYDIEIYEWIEDYVLNRKDCTIASLKLHKNLEQAKSNILEYFEALNLDEILRDGYKLSALCNKGSPAKVTKENVKSKKRGTEYNVFRYSDLRFRYSDLIMDCEVNKKVLYDNTAAVQEIGYVPDFCAQKNEFGYIQNGSIYISGVRKIKWTHDKYGYYKHVDDLGRYYGDESDKYKELFELLQGLVVPLE